MRRTVAALSLLSACGAPPAPAGPDCATIEAATPGGFASLAGLPVSAAVANIPALRRFSSLLAAAGMVEELDARPALTFFAPIDAAFEKARTWPESDPRALRSLVAWMVLPGRRAGPALSGTQPTLATNPIYVTSAEEAARHGADPGAVPYFLEGHAIRVVCGNVQTANATLHLTDGVPAQK